MAEQSQNLSSLEISEEEGTDEVSEPWQERLRTAMGPAVLEFDRIVGFADTLLSGAIRIARFEGSRPFQAHEQAVLDFAEVRALLDYQDGRPPVQHHTHALLRVSTVVEQDAHSHASLHLP